MSFSGTGSGFRRCVAGVDPLLRILGLRCRGTSSAAHKNKATAAKTSASITNKDKEGVGELETALETELGIFLALRSGSAMCKRGVESDVNIAEITLVEEREWKDVNCNLKKKVYRQDSTITGYAHFSLLSIEQQEYRFSLYTKRSALLRHCAISVVCAATSYCLPQTNNYRQLQEKDPGAVSVSEDSGVVNVCLACRQEAWLALRDSDRLASARNVASPLTLKIVVLVQNPISLVSYHSSISTKSRERGGL